MKRYTNFYSNILHFAFLACIITHVVLNAVKLNYREERSVKKCQNFQNP